MANRTPGHHAQSGTRDVARNRLAQPSRAVLAGHAVYRVPDVGEPALPAFLVAAAVFIDLLLYGLVVPIVPGYVRSLGAGTGLLGIVFAAYAVGLFAVIPWLRCWPSGSARDGS